MWKALQNLVETETVIGPGWLILSIWAVVVIAVIVKLSGRKSSAKHTAAYLDKNPEAVKVLITEYLNQDEAILVRTVNDERPAFFRKFGVIDGFYAKPGKVEFVAKHERYGLVGKTQKAVKSTGWIEMDFVVEEDKRYSLRFDEKAQEFLFWEIEE